MSVKVKKTKIAMTRGDTAKINILLINDDGEVYTPVEGDKIRFAAKRSYMDEKPCILIDIPIETCELHIKPEDTKNLEQPCYLVYDIEMTFKDGTVDTFIKGELKIEEEVC